MGFDQEVKLSFERESAVKFICAELNNYIDLKT